MGVGNFSYSQRPTCRRLLWISFSNFLTFLIPNAALYYVVGLHTVAAALLCFWLEFVSTLVCTPKKLFDYHSIFSNSSKLSAIHGSVVDWSDYSTEISKFVNQNPHHDLSLNFPKIAALQRASPTSAYSHPILNECIFNLNMSAQADDWLNYYLEINPGYDFQNNALLHCPKPGHPNITGAPCFDGWNILNEYKTKGKVFYDPRSIKRHFNTLPTPNNSTKRAFVILNGNVLDVSAYLIGATRNIIMSSQYSSRSFVSSRTFLPLDLTLYMYNNLGKDITDFFDRNMTENPERYRTCIIELFQAGVSYNPTSCSQINPALWATMGIGFTYFLIKINLAHLVRIPFFQKILFFSAPEFSSSFVTKPQEWPHTLLMVPCFSESPDTLRQTFDNLARTSYDDSKKLLLFVCDGVAVNSDTKKETYKLLLDSLGHSSYMEEPTARSYASLGQNTRRINYAKVYSGYYETGRNRVPYLVIVKIGNTKERLQKHPAPPGNRGKRDSLVLVFSFLERCMDLTNKLVTSLDYEIFNQCYNVLGIDPRSFKYLLLTDADVQVQSNVVHKLVLRLEHDCKMLAVSGHVRPANPEENLTTMIQIFPVYMDFFTGLAYEACLRSVTAINGGLVMFKIWTEKGDTKKHYKKQKDVEEYRLNTIVKVPKVSDEIITTSPFDDRHASGSITSIYVINNPTHTKSKLNKSVAKLRPESSLKRVPNNSVQACCIHPTVLRGICTPQPNTMHMQNLLLLGEERYLSIVLLSSHPGHQLGFEPDAEGYTTLPSSFRSLQELQTRNIRASFHTLLEMNRVSWRLGFRYWLVTTFELIDMIFSTPITIYIYVIFVRSIQGFGMSYTIIACAFSGLIVLHMLMFLFRRQVKYILWFALYCILSVPIFAVWFPLLALWKSDSADTWYDMSPTATPKPYGARTHGIIEYESTAKQNTTENKDSNIEEPQEILRLTLDQFDRMEIQRQRKEAEAALDSKFAGFSTDNDNNGKQKQNQTQNKSESPTSINTPPLVQVRNGLHSTRLAHTFTDRRIYGNQPNQFTVMTNVEGMIPTANDPFDDKNAVLSEFTKNPSETRAYHKSTHSQSSFESNEVNGDTNSDDFQKRYWENSASEDNMELYDHEATFDDRGSMLSIISHTFSMNNDVESMSHQRPMHRLDTSLVHNIQNKVPEEGRKRAVHTNIRDLAASDCQNNIPHKIDHKQIPLKHKKSGFGQYPVLHNKSSLNTLTPQLTNYSNLIFNSDDLQETESQIYNDIKNYMHEVHPDSITMTKKILFMITCVVFLIFVSFVKVSKADIEFLSWKDAYTRAQALVKEFSLDQKVHISTGIGWEVGKCVGNTPEVTNPYFPSLCLQDSPLGIRLASDVTVGIAGINAAASFDKDVIYRRGKYMGKEFRGKGVNVQLGPAMNFMRSPYGGRGWESAGEDPFLNGVTAAETIKGVQSQGVIATAKHFILNDQEVNRTKESSDVDNRTLHEIYLWPFARSVEAGVGSVMCSYNLVNSTYACENDHLLNTVLKKELGFRGFVQSDWYATMSTVSSANNGLDMNMPGNIADSVNGTYFGENLIKAIKSKKVPESRVTDMATRIIATWYRFRQDKDYPKVSLDSFNLGNAPHVNVRSDHHKLVREMAAASTVLLKNDGILPLKSVMSVAYIGMDASVDPNGINSCLDHGCDKGTLPIGWGSGSAILPYLVDPITGLSKAFGKNVEYKKHLNNWDTKGASKVAKNSDVAFVFANADSGEEYIKVDGNIGDRKNLSLWQNGDNLIKSVADANNNTIVIIHSVGPVIMPWVDHPNIKAIVWPGLPGQESGNSLADVITGKVNPSGRLPYTIAKKASDYNTKPSFSKHIKYTEKLLMGYKWFDKKNLTPQFPFGYGMSYTKFEYRDLEVNTTSNRVNASVIIKNSGSFDGAEIVQVYLSFPEIADEPPKLLRGFEKVFLKKGMNETVNFTLGPTELSIWDTRLTSWKIPSGNFTIHIGASSRDIKKSLIFFL